MKKIVITGALGHIGSSLIRHFGAAFPGTEILLLDNMATNRYCSLFDLPDSGTYSFVEADILTADLATVFKGASTVIHLAAITDAENSFKIKDRVEEVNYQGTRKVAEACLAAGSSLIFPSTTSVYGSQSQLVSESCPESELKPQSPYAETKLKSENFLSEFGQKNGLKFVTLRLGTIFGPSIGMRFHTAVNKFSWQAVLGQPLSVWQTALHQKRPYLDLSDAVRAIEFVLKQNLFTNEIYNVVTTNATVNDILSVIKLFIKDVEVKFVDSAIMNQLSYEVDCSKFKALGFPFEGKLERGIGETLQLIKGMRHGSFVLK